MIEITHLTFDEKITNQPGWVLLQFWAPGCGPCHLLQTELRCIEQEYPTVAFLSMNAADYAKIAWSFEIMAVPGMVLFYEGVPQKTTVGYMPRERLRQWIDSALQQHTDISD